MSKIQPSQSSTAKQKSCEELTNQIEDILKRIRSAPDEELPMLKALAVNAILSAEIDTKGNTAEEVSRLIRKIRKIKESDFMDGLGSFHKQMSLTALSVHDPKEVLQVINKTICSKCPDDEIELTLVGSLESPARQRY